MKDRFLWNEGDLQFATCVPPSEEESRERSLAAIEEFREALKEWREKRGKECPNLQIHIWVRTGQKKYRCEWMEDGVLRECNHKSLYECCPARLEYDKESREKYER